MSLTPPSSKPFLRVFEEQPSYESSSPPPIWLMRQAGRYLSEYQATRAQAGGFLDLCYTPELAEEVTLQPIRRYGFDAAILFADILLIPQALGQELWFETGEGPRLAPISNADDLSLHGAQTHLAPISVTVKRLSQSLPPHVALIGFAGAPWTVAVSTAAERDCGPLLSVTWHTCGAVLATAEAEMSSRERAVAEAERALAEETSRIRRERETFDADRENALEAARRDAARSARDQRREAPPRSGGGGACTSEAEWAPTTVPTTVG